MPGTPRKRQPPPQRPNPLHRPAYRALPGLLREWRESAGLSTRDLARVMGTNVAWINRSERGHRRVDAVEFLAWLRACRVSLTEAARALERTGR